MSCRSFATREAFEADCDPYMINKFRVYLNAIKAYENFCVVDLPRFGTSFKKCREWIMENVAGREESPDHRAWVCYERMGLFFFRRELDALAFYLAFS